MPTYNPNDFSPMSGKEINSQGNVVTPADGINTDGSQNVRLSGSVMTTLLEDTSPSAHSIAPTLFYETAVFDLTDAKEIHVSTYMAASFNYTIFLNGYMSDGVTQISTSVSIKAGAVAGNATVSLTTIPYPKGTIKVVNNDTTNTFSLGLRVYKKR